MESASGIEVVKVSGSTVTTVETHGEMNTGDPDTPSWWVERAKTLCPSTYFGLSLWDHGSGWQWVCSDMTAP